MHYLAALAFDLLALGVACAFVLRHAPQPLRVGCGLTSFPRALFEQGALYYVGLARASFSLRRGVTDADERPVQ